MENFDFTPVPEPVFDELRNAFGVENESRDIIQRKVVKGTILNNQIFIEYYPLEFKVVILHYLISFDVLMRVVEVDQIWIGALFEHLFPFMERMQTKRNKYSHYCFIFLV